MKLLSVFYSILSCDLRLAYRRQTEAMIPLIFFIIVVSLFPLAIKSEPRILQHIAPAIIWVAALLGTLVGLNSLFYSDFLDGSLEQLLLSPYPLAWLVLAKVCAHWLVTGLPLVLIAPFLAFSFYLPLKSVILLFISLLIGTPSLSLMGGMILSLTVGLRNGSMLLALLILPLYIPILIFGANVTLLQPDGFLNEQLAWLSAILFLALPICPWITAGVLRMSVI